MAPKSKAPFTIEQLEAYITANCKKTDNSYIISPNALKAESHLTDRSFALYLGEMKSIFAVDEHGENLVFSIPGWTPGELNAVAREKMKKFMAAMDKEVEALLLDLSNENAELKAKIDALEAPAALETPAALDEVAPTDDDLTENE